MKTLSLFSSVLILSVSAVFGLVPSVLPIEPKTIHISSTAGGISHIAWTLEIGKVLAERGHNVSFLTTDIYTKHGVPYQPHIRTISLGPHISNVQFRDLFDTEEPMSKKVTEAYRQVIQDTYKRDYYAYLRIFNESNTDIVICDQLSLPCFDAAKQLNIAMVIHMTMSLSQDTWAPFITSIHVGDQATTKFQSFKTRWTERFIETPKFLWRFFPVGKAVLKERKELGIAGFDPLGRHSNTIKLINSFWGMDSPRPVGPFVEYVGPIISSTYDPLPQDLSRFMDTHDRVVYIAFGQMYVPNREESTVLLTSLMEAYEQKHLDGFIWSLKDRSILPETVTTRSGNRYKVQQDLVEGHMDIVFAKWSPQFAILKHPHCKLFVSHGGASSVHESLFNGVPLLLHPFASDQPSNANNIASAGVALVLDRRAHNVTDTVDKLSALLLDKDGKFASNMKSMQSLVHVRSRRKYYAADVIEEVLASVRNKSDIWYRREVSEDMAWYKATNWDVDLAAFGLVSFILYSVTKVLKVLVLFVLQHIRKIKTD